jgi:hypothetical protein
MIATDVAPSLRPSIPGPPGRRVRQRLTPTNGAGHPTEAGRAAHRCWAAHLWRGEALPRPTAPIGAANPCARYRRHRQSIRHRAHYRTRGLTGPAGPAGQAAPDPYNTGPITRPEPAMQRTGAEPPTCVGARRCLARPRQGRGQPLRQASAASAVHPTPRPLPYPGTDRPCRAGGSGPAAPTKRGRSPDRSRPCRRVRQRLTPYHGLGGDQRSDRRRPEVSVESVARRRKTRWH